MTLTKSETDAAILAAAKQADVPPNSYIRVRNTTSVHPVQCFCEVCKALKFKPYSAEQEHRVKQNLNYYEGS